MASGVDIELHHIAQGPGANGDAVPFVLLHGNGEDSSYFASQIEHFSQARRVIAIDTRGHGESPRGSAPFSLAQFACDLLAFFDAHGIARADILGFSDGGNIALLFALEHPERVRKLVLNGANLFYEGLTQETRSQIEEELRAAQAANDTRQLELLRLMTDEPNIDPAHLATLDIPTLVIVGSYDMVEDAHTRLIAQSIPGAELAIIEGSHFIAAENPTAFNKVISAFLAG